MKRLIDLFIEWNTDWCLIQIGFFVFLKKTDTIYREWAPLSKRSMSLSKCFHILIKFKNYFNQKFKFKFDTNKWNVTLFSSQLYHYKSSTENKLRTEKIKLLNENKTKLSLCNIHSRILHYHTFERKTYKKMKKNK